MEEKIYEPKKVKVKRPFMKFLSGFCTPIGIALLIIGIVFVIALNYDKNEVNSIGKEYWDWMVVVAKRDVSGQRFTAPPMPDEPEHHYAFYSRNDSKNFDKKIANLSKSGYADYVFNYYMDKLCVVPMIISGFVLLVAGIVTRRAYKVGQKEEVSDK